MKRYRVWIERYQLMSNKILVSVHQANKKYLLSTYYIPDTFPGTGHISEQKERKIPALVEFAFLMGEKDK